MHGSIFNSNLTLLSNPRLRWKTLAYKDTVLITGERSFTADIYKITYIFDIKLHLNEAETLKSSSILIF